MFFTKKKELVPCDCFKDKVKCEICKCWLDKKDAQEIEVTIYGYYSDESINKKEYYCYNHTKAYEKIISIINVEGDVRKVYYKQLEVDEKGNVIKQK